MPRFLAVAIAAFLLALPTVAAAQTTALPADGSCAEPANASPAVPAVSDGGGTPAPTATPVSDSGGGSAPSGSDGSTAEGGASSTSASSGAGGSSSGSGDGVPLATAAQEPEPEPEGPGSEQPEEPGGEPQPPTGEEQPDTGGGLPQTGFKALQLGLLGLVLVLVGARIRAIAKRRRRPATGGLVQSEGDDVELAPDGLPRSGSVVAYRESAEETEALLEDDDEIEHHARDEWSFPDPDEPAPSGLLPSTAIARRQARRQRDEAEGD